MKLYFSNDEYRKKALSTLNVEKSKHTVGDAFLLITKDLPKEDLSNLISIMEKELNLPLDICYKMTQNEVSVNDITKSKIVELAYKCIESGKTLGEKTINNCKINTSSWISHVLYEGKLAREFAIKLGVDPATAQIQGILHDYGRKITHSFEHVTKGYEKLIDERWEKEAISCLTHSFLNGGRCASNEQAEEGFFVDENGNPCWKDGTDKDDITIFLENYKYSTYDKVLNIADLMATSQGIVSPYDRIADIATRRKLDSTNRGYFLAEFSNTLVDILEKTGGKIPETVKEPIKATPNLNIEEINERFKAVSDIFYTHYKSNIAKQKNNLIEEREI